MTTSEEKTRFRLMMAWAPSSGSEDLELAATWLDKLNAGYSKKIQACIWMTQGSLAEVDYKYQDRFCWHFLELPKTVDRYVRGPIPRGLWSPWGNKSGPNYQFFRQLDEMAQAHGDTWVLQIEGDTFCVTDSPRNYIQGLIDTHPEAWVIGGVNHPAVLLSVPRKLHQHVNGAALYNFASSEFREFREAIWIPSLIEALQQDVELAYDCMSSPGLQEELGPTLRKGWHENNDRFIRNPGIVNASSLSFEDPAKPPEPELKFLRDHQGQADQVWLFHAKKHITKIRRFRELER
jgi:hypothetical protein